MAGESKVFSGAKARLIIGGKTIAYCSNINITQENTLVDVDVIDQLEVMELVEVGHKVSFSVGVFKVNENTAAFFGFDYSTEVNTLLIQAETTMQIFDTKTFPDEDGSGNLIPLYEISGVKFEGGSGSVDSRGVWQGTWNFRGIKKSGGSL